MHPRESRIDDGAGPPRLTVVVLAWDGLEDTQRCVASIRANTDVPYELIIVDNGSGPDAVRYAREAADRSILNEANRGFAPGMNQGLWAGHGEYVAFCNNDTEVPPTWASTLIEDFRTHPDAGIVVPAVTAAGNPCTVRSTPGAGVEVLLPFGEFPSGVLYVMPRDLAQELEGWSEEYPIASAEDLDLCFKVWANGLSVVLDERILVHHVSQATVGAKLDNRDALYRSNLRLFMDKWSSSAPAVPRLERCAPEEFEFNLRRAATAIQWVRRLIDTRAQLAEAHRQLRSLEDRVEPSRTLRPAALEWPIFGFVARALLRALRSIRRHFRG